MGEFELDGGLDAADALAGELSVLLIYIYIYDIHFGHGWVEGGVYTLSTTYPNPLMTKSSH